MAAIFEGHAPFHRFLNFLPSLVRPIPFPCSIRDMYIFNDLSFAFFAFFCEVSLKSEQRGKEETKIEN